MDFGKIKKNFGEIKIEEWNEIMASFPMLEQAPDRKGVNPFTGEDITFPGVGVAYYCESGERVGNLCLQDGELFTSGVPASFCDKIAASLNAVALEDDRS